MANINTERATYKRRLNEERVRIVIYIQKPPEFVLLPYTEHECEYSHIRRINEVGLSDAMLVGCAYAEIEVHQDRSP